MGARCEPICGHLLHRLARCACKGVGERAPSCRVIMPYAVMPPRLGIGPFALCSGPPAPHTDPPLAESRNAHCPTIFPISAITSRRQRMMANEGVVRCMPFGHVACAIPQIPGRYFSRPRARRGLIEPGDILEFT